MEAAWLEAMEAQAAPGRGRGTVGVAGPQEAQGQGRGSVVRKSCWLQMKEVVEMMPKHRGARCMMVQGVHGAEAVLEQQERPSSHTHGSHAHTLSRASFKSR